jgi:hypothetical protein
LKTPPTYPDKFDLDTRFWSNLMEQAVAPENYRIALAAVKRNDGSPGIDHMPTADLEKHLETH